MNALLLIQNQQLYVVSRIGIDALHMTFLHTGVNVIKKKKIGV